MNATLNAPIVDGNRIPIRPFSDFLNYVSYHLIPKGAIILFKGTAVPKGYTEVVDVNLPPPTGYKYGSKN